MTKKVSDYFHGKEKYNCAQAVLKYFQDDLNVTTEEIDSFSKCGGGRAEGGICGALYAVHRLVHDPELIKEIDDYFLSQAGSTQCKEIRNLKRVTCAASVDLAAEAFKKVMAGK